MVQRLALSFIGVALLAGGAAVADPGPNGSNNHGLCTAYFNGSANGQSNKRKAGPFAALEQTAGDADGNGTPNEPTDVWAWCNLLENNPKGIGGQPDDPNTATEDPNGGSGQAKGKKK